jgi:putative transposase
MACSAVACFERVSNPEKALATGYATDITDEQWERLRPYVEPKTRRGPKSKVDRGRVINAIFYRLRTGCPWRLLPRDHPPWTQVAGDWRRWMANGLGSRINAA